VLEQVDQKTEQRALIARVSSSELKCFGHMSRLTSLQKDNIVGSNANDDKAGRKHWLDELTEWTAPELG